MSDVVGERWGEGLLFDLLQVCVTWEQRTFNFRMLALWRVRCRQDCPVLAVSVSTGNGINGKAERHDIDSLLF